MKVLVTGANGMIGAAVLRSVPTQVTGLRAQMGPIPGRTGRGRGSAPIDRSVVCDIGDRDALAPLVEGIDVVVHLAGPPSVADSFHDPAGCLRAHVLGARTVAGLCLDRGVPRLVHVSSAEVYGRPSSNPVGETAQLAPRSPYGVAKMGAEAVIATATRDGALDAVILRPFSIYGPGQRRESLVGAMLRQVLAGERVRVRNPGVVRDYCFVDDLAGAIWRAATCEVAGCQALNVATGHGIAVAELARAAGAAAGRDGADAVPVLPGRGADRPAHADIVELVAAVDRVEHQLDWRATTTLAEGLVRTLEWVAADGGSKP